MQPRFHEPSDLERAYHEAGHVVVAYALDWPLIKATIDFDPKAPGLWGQVEHRIKSYSDIDHARRRLIVVFAGRYGEALVTGQSRSQSSAADDVEIDEICQGIEPQCSRLESAFAADNLASKIVEENSEAVEDVAQALVRKRTLDWDAICRILDSMPRYTLP